MWLMGGTSDTFVFRTFNGNEKWEFYPVTQGNLFRVVGLPDKPRTPEFVNVSPYCNAYNPVAQSNRTNGTVSGSANSLNVDFIDNRFTSLAEWKTHLSTNPLQVAYLKETPTTLTTPATPISLNKRNNTLSTSGDNMTITYKGKGISSLQSGLSMMSPELTDMAEEDD